MKDISVWELLVSIIMIAILVSIFGAGLTVNTVNVEPTAQPTDSVQIIPSGLAPSVPRVPGMPHIPGYDWIP